jgi:outer membrane cobalamin receptor
MNRSTPPFWDETLVKLTPARLCLPGSLLFALPLCAQTTATLTGHVLDPSGKAIPGATIVVENPVTKYRSQTESKEDGTFSVRNIPFHTYQVMVLRDGFAPREQSLSLRSAVPTNLSVQLELASSNSSVTVAATEQDLLVNPEETGTHVQMDQSDIDRISRQIGNRGLEAVIVSFPGFAQNANGAIHPRGAHNQMTYVVDGMPISDQLTGAFANSLDPSIVQTVELFTGNVPAEYGSKVSAVANITTRTGLGSGKPVTGSVTVSGAGFGLLSQVTQVAGEVGRWSYSGTVNTMMGKRYLDSVSLDNFHNGGNSERGFLRVDYQTHSGDVLRLNGMAGRSSFQLANLLSQQATGMDQRQLLRDAAAAFAWVHPIDAKSTFDNSASYRTTAAQLFPSAGDTPVTASQARHLSTFTNASRLNLLRGRNIIRMGADVQAFPVSENFSFGITSPLFNLPGTEGYNPNLAPYDLSRGGSSFQFSDRATGAMYSGFLQDSLKLGDWQLSLGLRYDYYNFLVRGYQFQPRLGAAYHLKRTNTVLRASYSRTFQTPPNENLLLSASSEAAAIAPPAVGAALGSAVAPITPERQNFFEAGIQQGAGRLVSVDVSYYHKQSVDQQDNNNFLNTGIIFPITLSKIRINGVEGRVSLAPIRGFGATVSITHAKAVSTPPFTGGLYIGNDAIAALTAGPFIIDHDQVLAVQGILTYNSRSGFYSTLSMRYDSGLVANPSDPVQVALDPDYRDLLPYVNLLSNPPRVLPRLVIDLSGGYERLKDGRKRWDLSCQMVNVTNQTALYNFQSVFVGTRVIQPFTAGGRFRVYF